MLTDLDVGSLAKVADGAVVVVSIARGRQIVATGSAAATSTLRIASLTKPVTAVATVRAANARGDPSTRRSWRSFPRADALPRAGSDVTIAHALSQTSGLAPTGGAETVSGLIGDEALLQAAHLVMSTGTVAQPGEGWEYFNGINFVAGALAATLHGKPYEVTVRDFVLEPCHMRHT